MTYYDILGVPRDATIGQIRSAYREQIHFFHPDIFDGNPSVAEEKTRQLNEAYSILSSPRAKSKYDKSLHASEKAFLDQFTQSITIQQKYEEIKRHSLIQKLLSIVCALIVCALALVVTYIVSSSRNSQVAELKAQVQTLTAELAAAQSQISNTVDKDEVPTKDTSSSSLRSTRNAKAVWVTPSGSKYHLRSCSTIRGHDVERTTLGEAEDAGYTPCKVCDP